MAEEKSGILFSIPAVNLILTGTILIAASIFFLHLNIISYFELSAAAKLPATFGIVLLFTGFFFLIKRKDLYIDFNRLLWIILFSLLTIILFHSLNRRFDRDELEVIHTSWKILHSERIYVDFFQNHHPFYYYLLIPLIAVFGEHTSTLIVMRVLSFLIILLILFVTYQLAKKIFNKEVAFFSLILLAATRIFINKAIEIRSDLPQALFGLISLFFLFSYFERRSLKSLALSSFSLGISFLFLQKTLFLIFWIGILLLIKVCKRRIHYRDVLFYLLGLLLPIVCYLLYLLKNNSISSYLFFSWIFNMKYIAYVSPLGSFGYTLKRDALLWVFYVWGLISFLKTPPKRQVGLLSLGLLLSLFFTRTCYTQYFMIQMPLIAMIAANAIYSLFEKDKNRMAMALILTIVFPSFVLLKGTTDTNSRQLKKIEYVLSLTSPGDYVYDGDSLFNVFRKDIDFFWFSLSDLGALATYKSLRNYNYDIYASLERSAPKVISNYYIGNMDDERITRNYEQSPEYSDLFIRKY